MANASSTSAPKTAQLRAATRNRSVARDLTSIRARHFGLKNGTQNLPTGAKLRCDRDTASIRKRAVSASLTRTVRQRDRVLARKYRIASIRECSAAGLNQHPIRVLALTRLPRPRESPEQTARN